MQGTARPPYLRIGSASYDYRTRMIVRAALFGSLVLVAALGGPVEAVAQRGRGNVSPATDFVFNDAFTVRPPDVAYWTPPPGGLLEDGRYESRLPAEQGALFLTMATEFSGRFLESPHWQNPTFIDDYHEWLLAAEVTASQGPGVGQSIAFSAAELDRRFSIPAIRRTIRLEQVSRNTGLATRIITREIWRFPHPQSPILEFVVTISSAGTPSETTSEVSEDALGFLTSLEALPLDTAPDSSIPIPSNRADAIAIGHDAIWVTDYGTKTLSRIDPVTKQVSGWAPVGAGPHAIATTTDAVWVANHNDDTITRVDPASVTVTAIAQTSTGPHQILNHQSGLWLVTDASCLVTRIDPRSGAAIGDKLYLGSIRRSISGRRERLWGVLGQRVDPCTDMSVTVAPADSETLYAFERFKGTLNQIRPTVERPIKTRAEVGGFLIDGKDLWGVDNLDFEGKIYRIDVVSGKILAAIDGGRVSGTPLLSRGLLWVARESQNSVIRIDTSTNAISGSPIPVMRPAGLASDDTGIWVAGGHSIVHISFE